MLNKKNIRIIYEDDYLIVVDKPSGLLVVPTHAGQYNDLTSFLNLELKNRKLTVKAHPCHRLDKQTSGLVIFAKGKKMQQIVMEQFYKKQVRKIYIAFIQGHLKKRKGVLKSYIQDPWPYIKMKGKGKYGITKFETIYNGEAFSIIKLELLTGRTNQVRIQFRDIRHPLLGERRFAFARDWPLKFKRVALHAFKLQFIHPVTKQRVYLRSELPKDMDTFLERKGILFSSICVNL